MREKNKKWRKKEAKEAKTKQFCSNGFWERRAKYYKIMILFLCFLPFRANGHRGSQCSAYTVIWTPLPIAVSCLCSTTHRANIEENYFAYKFINFAQRTSCHVMRASEQTSRPSWTATWFPTLPSAHLSVYDRNPRSRVCVCVCL